MVHSTQWPTDLGHNAQQGQPCIQLDEPSQLSPREIEAVPQGDRKKVAEMAYKVREERIARLLVSDPKERPPELYILGLSGVTDIKWSVTHGPYSMLDTIQVYKHGQLSSEHPFTNCQGVYFLVDDEEGRDDAPE